MKFTFCSAIRTKNSDRKEQECQRTSIAPRRPARRRPQPRAASATTPIPRRAGEPPEVEPRLRQARFAGGRAVPGRAVVPRFKRHVVEPAWEFDQRVGRAEQKPRHRHRQRQQDRAGARCRPLITHTTSGNATMGSALYFVENARPATRPAATRRPAVNCAWRRRASHIASRHITTMGVSTPTLAASIGQRGRDRNQ